MLRRRTNRESSEISADAIDNRQQRYRTLSKSRSAVFLPRLVQRDLPFHQSQNKISVYNEKHRKHIWPLLIRDWFHVLLRLPAWSSTMALLIIWTLVILIFASIYIRIDSNNQNLDCGLGEPGSVIAWATSFAFSLETCTTVGYGLPGSTNAFFESNCPSVQVAIYAQMLWSMMFNAFLFAFFFAQMSKCESRSLQVVFSEKLCINMKGEKIFVTARCYDVDAVYPVVETHVRMYVMDKQMKMHAMRLVKPDDDLGSMLYTSIPVEMTHHVDHHSILSPRKLPLVLNNHGIVLRSADSATGNRDEIVCPVCGEAYGTYDRLMKHVQYNRIVEARDEYPQENTHLGFDMPDINPLTLEEVAQHIERNMSEIVVVVEGIDPQVSGTFQALQSYKYEDIAWEADFEPCLAVNNNKFVVDLSKFHGVLEPLSPPNSIAEDQDPEQGDICRLKTRSTDSEVDTPC